MLWPDLTIVLYLVGWFENFLLQNISKVCRAWRIFLSTTWKSLSLVIIVPNGKSKLGADFFLQWFEIYGYIQFEMRRTLVCKFFFTLKLWPDNVFNRNLTIVLYLVGWFENFLLQNISKVCRAWRIFLSTTWKSLSLVIIVPNGKSKLGADFFLQWFEIYGYTQFEMRRTLVCKFFFTLKLWPDNVFNRHVPAIIYPVIIRLAKIAAQTSELNFNTPLIRPMGIREVSSCKYEEH